MHESFFKKLQADGLQFFLKKGFLHGYHANNFPKLLAWYPWRKPFFKYSFSCLFHILFTYFPVKTEDGTQNFKQNLRSNHPRHRA